MSFPLGNGERPSLRASARRRTSGSLGGSEADGRSDGVDPGCGATLPPWLTLWCAEGERLEAGGAMLGAGGGALNPRFSRLASA